jgi:dienelactone hydrolase
VLRLAAQAGEKVAAVVFYRAVSPDEDFVRYPGGDPGSFRRTRPGHPLQLACAEMEQIHAKAGVPVEVYFYDAGHPFANDPNLIGICDEDAAKLARTRTLEFLHAHLTGG